MIQFGPLYRQHGLGEVGRELKRHVDAGEDISRLAHDALEWLLEVGNQTTTVPNRHLVEIPDTFAVARWPRDADIGVIATCIVATLKYEPHRADVEPLRQVLKAFTRNAQAAA